MGKNAILIFLGCQNQFLLVDVDSLQDACANQLARYSAGVFCLPAALGSVHCLIKSSRELVNLWLRNLDLPPYAKLLVL